MQLSDIDFLQLTATESRTIERLVDELLDGHGTQPVGHVADSAHIYSQRFPERLRAHFYKLAHDEAAKCLCVRGMPWSAERVPPTPSSLATSTDPELVDRHDTAHLLCAALLGEPFTWSTIQNARLFNDVIPISGHEHQPMSSSSASAFGLHTEDAFHPLAGDFLGLMCLRNPNNAETVLADLPTGALSENQLRALAEPRYLIGANVAHRGAPPGRRSALLFGSLTSPYLRINANRDPEVSDDPEARAAYEALANALSANALRVTFRQGEYWFIDNYRVAHGREAFAARYDGSDRWLRRLYITSSWRRSRSLRTAPTDRVFHIAEARLQLCT